ncbi:uncharacterized protein LOC113146897 [Cyclospora cayetanensis]|uniref:Uncharacterized protein LOC113146897 n=1 Tax=Cyclospora cayetanensis TaxID=88456 RepID=A0A6P6RU89_9EIME|nr:uncharacterized protein LOC113146897 [Cyclospora cayetanensis]
MRGFLPVEKSCLYCHVCRCLHCHVAAAWVAASAVAAAASLFLQSFVQDPLIEWRTALSRHQQQQQQREAAAASAWERKAYTCIVNIQQKLRGAISALPPGAFEFSVHHQKDPQKEETRENADDGSSSSSSEASFLESEDEEAQAPAAAGSSAVAAAAHGSVGTLGVHAQVDALIRAATAEENLARMYVGWLPWY